MPPPGEAFERWHGFQAMEIAPATIELCHTTMALKGVEVPSRIDITFN